MKKLSLFLTYLLISVLLVAQSPQRFSFQAVIRDAQSVLVKNKAIGIRFTIMQGSLSGEAVYVETQSAGSNSNGLITAEVGAGTTVYGSFDSIAWWGGPFYIKSEFDPHGGTNYTLNTSSQLLSVPYALYAKSSESLIGDNLKHYVGELFEGGIVFYVDYTRLHGKICSLIDVGNDVVWSNIQSTEIGSQAQSYWDGFTNTNSIIDQAGHINSAAMLCAEYTNEDYGTGIYTDWYLPSIDECNILHQVIFEIDKWIELNNIPNTHGLSKKTYWSSTEAGDNGAWYYDFFVNQHALMNKASPFNVRAVRAF